MMPRDHNTEYQDTADRQYAYDLDYVVHQYMIRTFEPFLGQGRALELGCYKGEFTRRLTTYYSDLTVIEAASDLIREARAAVGDRATFIHSTFEAAVLDQTFDAIFLVHTLEHLDHPVQVLKQINRWLSSRGRLFLVVPNANAASRQIAVSMGLIAHSTAVTEGEARHGHRRTYTLDTLERDARDGGLSVHQRGGIFFKPLANFQFDQAIRAKIVSEAYLEGCYALGMKYPDLCASIYLLCGKGS
jgi:2-polyprenyl-3-methyl-5-hydroxy-6-metoxy-1,4-benzoquinol methylase